MAKSVQDFINQYNGKRVDDDYVANVQCVDGFRVGCKYWGYPAQRTNTGWADGYWFDRYGQGWDKYFEFITNPKALRPGDWCFWARGSRSCPSSHVSMFVSYTNTFKTTGNFFGENQGSVPNAGFSIGAINLDICGAFRPKALINTEQEAEYVKLLYTNILSRTYDTGGLRTWVNALDNGVLAKNVISGFFNSKEYLNKKKSNADFLTDCYSGYLHRKPDASGLKYWTTKLNNGATRQTVQNGFGNSAEFKRLVAKYGLR